MPSSYTPLKIQLMGTGENSGTWGDVTNTNLGTAVEEAIANTAEVLFSGANVQLALTNTNTSQPARKMRLYLYGSSSGARELEIPAVQKMYLVTNSLADPVTVRNATGTGTVVPAGASMIVYNDGVNVSSAMDHASSLTLSTALALASGGTGGNTAATARTNLLPSYTGNASKALVVNAGATDVEYATVGDVFTTAVQDLSNKSIFATRERVSVSPSGSSGTVNFDVLTSSVLYYQGVSSGNWSLNIRGNASTTLNSTLAVGDAISIAFLNTNGSTGYYQGTILIDGNTVSAKWQGGTQPTSGNANSIDSYLVTVIKTGEGVYTVLEAQTRFA